MSNHIYLDSIIFLPFRWISIVIPYIGMVMGVPHRLKQWWRNIQSAHRDDIRMHLGALTALKHVQKNRVLTKLLIKFCNPAKAVFTFVDSEMASILEEVTSFTKFPFA